VHGLDAARERLTRERGERDACATADGQVADRSLEYLHLEPDRVDVRDRDELVAHLHGLTRHHAQVGDTPAERAHHTRPLQVELGTSYRDLSRIESAPCTRRPLAVGAHRL